MVFPLARLILRTSMRSRELSRKKCTDISGWNRLGIEAGGTRKKFILQPPSGGKWYLAKFPQYGQFEIVTEVFNSILAVELGINHVSYFPIIYMGLEGVACASFIEHNRTDGSNEELWEMKELVCRHSNLINLERRFGRDDDVLKEHQIENIYMILEAEFGESVLPDFFAMVGLDALIGHGDRHWSNYGAIVSMDNNAIHSRFAPLYDTASGYLTEIGENERLFRMLNDELNSDAWYQVRRKRLCKITVAGNPKASHFDVMERILSDKDMSKFRAHLERPFRKYSDQLVRAILNRFFPKLDTARRDVIKKILSRRYRIAKKMLGI